MLALGKHSRVYSSMIGSRVEKALTDWLIKASSSL